MRLRAEEVVTACSGVVISGSGIIADVRITGVSTDSRTVAPGDLYVPLAGPRFDGHAFIGQAAANGAVCVLSEQDNIPDIDGALPVIKVKSTYQALLDLAAYYRSLFNVKVVAVTGSAGKTSTKDMLASVLSQRYRTRKTEGNKNNNVGLPLTVFGLDKTDEVLVLEMGMNHTGEIRVLSQTARPHIAVITNIGDAHIENLGSREGILQAKLEITEGINDNGVLFVNGFDPLLAGLTGRHIFPVGLEGAEHAVYATDIEPLGLSGTRCVLHINGDTCILRVPQPGMHMVANALLAAAVGERLGLTLPEIARGIESYIPSYGRMEIIQYNGYTILNDVYNANPASMRATVGVLADVTAPNQPGSRGVCILGDMLELGSHAERLHNEVGCYIADRGISMLITVGTLARHIHQGYVDAGGTEARHFNDKMNCIDSLSTLIRAGDVVLVKASRGMKFEDIVATLGGQR